MSEFTCDRCGEPIDPNDESNFVALHDWVLCELCRALDEAYDFYFDMLDTGNEGRSL